MAASVQRIVPMMAFCEAPFDGTLDGTSAARPRPRQPAPAASVQRVVLVPMMAFCEAPFDGTLDGISGDGAAATRRALAMDQVAKRIPVRSSSSSSQRREQARQQEKAVDGVPAILETIAFQ